MADPVTFVVVGLGGISDSWLRVFTQTEDAEPVAFVDPDNSKFEKLKNYGEYYELPKFNRLEDAYAEVESEATLVLTPPQYHARYLIEAMENLNHVITEKPFCTETNELRHILERKQKIQEETGEELVTVVNQQYRFMERIEAIKNALWSGKIGEPGFVVSQFNEPDYHFNRWWRQQHQDISFANWYIHHIDTMRYILGKDPARPAARPVEVYSKLFRVPWTKIIGESSIFLQVKFDNGVQWSYNASQEARGIPSPGQSEFIIHCSNGTIENPRIGNPILTIGGGKDPQQETIGQDFGDVGYKYPPSWDHTMALFVDAVRTGKPNPRLTVFDDNKWTVAIMFCARESMRTGRAINVHDYMSKVVGPYFNE